MFDISNISTASFDEIKDGARKNYKLCQWSLFIIYSGLGGTYIRYIDKPDILESFKWYKKCIKNIAYGGMYFNKGSIEDMIRLLKENNYNKELKELLEIVNPDEYKLEIKSLEKQL